MLSPHSPVSNYLALTPLLIVHEVESGVLEQKEAIALDVFLLCPFM
jgi:hypothetical protein